ncbi:hypothetical protein [Mammaliicoccus sciuri]|uniref:hypothetical protein n=1 Tax=Mammaliicoccus sciuri TaxID=1296 RepID=UPI001784F5A9|nr:hypothetical protein [Mammaliicoccus sciuri]
MILLTLFVLNVSLGFGLLFAGLPLIQALYFSAFLTYGVGQIIMLVLETKKANTDGNQ